MNARREWAGGASACAMWRWPPAVALACTPAGVLRMARRRTAASGASGPRRAADCARSCRWDARQSEAGAGFGAPEGMRAATEWSAVRGETRQSCSDVRYGGLDAACRGLQSRLSLAAPLAPAGSRIAEPRTNAVARDRELRLTCCAQAAAPGACAVRSAGAVCGASRRARPGCPCVCSVCGAWKPFYRLSHVPGVNHHALSHRPPSPVGSANME